MSSAPSGNACEYTERLSAHALHALPRDEAAAMDAHLDRCPDCRKELDTLRPIIESFVSWPTDVLRPSTSLWDRLSERIAAETGEAPERPAPPAWQEPEWEEVAPGISCKLLSTDSEQDRVSMLVRLAPGVAYPPHRHAGIEELHLLDGELFIEDRKLLPGDYNLGEAGALDRFVYSETGCTCVLITSTLDVIQ
jgi:anti-sigma factor ChrR (cupin superfamily)